MTDKRVKTLIVFFYFLSGFSALTYEILWSRLLTLLTGNSTLSIILILSIFMGGLALGSVSFGNIKRNSLKVYALLEFLIGCYALFFFYYHEWLYYQLLPLFESQSLVFAQKGIPVFLLLFIPTFLMGGTFPVITHMFTDRSEQKGKWVGRLYGLNTLGSMMGAWLTGYFLLRLYGLELTNFIAALINIGIAFSCLWLKDPFQHQKKFRVSVRNLPKKQYYYSLFWVGWASMVYEIAWSRTLTLIIGSSIYAFSIVLTVFLMGIGLGSLLIGGFSEKRKDLSLLFACLQLCLIGFNIFAYLLIEKLPLIFYRVFDWLTLNIWKQDILQFSISSLILFVPCLMIGASLPVLAKLTLINEKATGPKLGRIYFFNSIGAMTGTLMAGIFLLPLLGSDKSIILAITVNAILAFIWLIRSKSIGHGFKFLAYNASILALLLVLAVLPPWKPEILTSGLSIYIQRYKDLGIDSERLLKELNKTQILYNEEGWNANVAVKEYGGVKSLLINGKADGSDGLDMDSELFAGHLPLLLHSDPKNVFLLGLGTGVTLHAIEQYNVEKIVCSEIEAL